MRYFKSVLLALVFTPLPLANAEQCHRVGLKNFVSKDKVIAALGNVCVQLLYGTKIAPLNDNKPVDIMTTQQACRTFKGHKDKLYMFTIEPVITKGVEHKKILPQDCIDMMTSLLDCPKGAWERLNGDFQFRHVPFLAELTSIAN
ncbi:hypothetical protein BU16DRAFT_535543 [Lophium mytilinum]|uniref:Secreted protein n=1 Tax=Lophium mytilinum TaxID=390894 RepID=A0A6A6R3M1_9PEZI|nr:hypothetical protein BU16DRAFT_535543 [Lophium mytilinum]